MPAQGQIGFILQLITILRIVVDASGVAAVRKSAGDADLGRGGKRILVGHFVNILEAGFVDGAGLSVWVSLTCKVLSESNWFVAREGSEKAPTLSLSWVCR